LYIFHFYWSPLVVSNLKQKHRTYHYILLGSQHNLLQLELKMIFVTFNMHAKAVGLT
jgi:hypothetical protein